LFQNLQRNCAVSLDAKKLRSIFRCKEIAQYLQIISLIQLHCWLSAVIFNLGVVNHIWRGHQKIFY